MEHLREVLSPHQFGVLLHFFGVNHVFLVTTDGTRKSPEFQLYVLEQHDHRTGWCGNSAKAKLLRLCLTEIHREKIGNTQRSHELLDVHLRNDHSGFCGCQWG